MNRFGSLQASCVFEQQIVLQLVAIRWERTDRQWRSSEFRCAVENL